jgi:hypothetical protein
MLVVISGGAVGAAGQDQTREQRQNKSKRFHGSNGNTSCGTGAIVTIRAAGAVISV